MFCTRVIVFIFIICVPRVTAVPTFVHYERSLMLRGAAACATCIIARPARAVLAQLRDKPLTQEEMAEYQDLLKQADRIQSVIEANKRAFLQDIETITNTTQKRTP